MTLRGHENRFEHEPPRVVFLLSLRPAEPLVEHHLQRFRARVPVGDVDGEAFAAAIAGPPGGLLSGEGIFKERLDPFSS